MTPTYLACRWLMTMGNLPEATASMMVALAGTLREQQLVGDGAARRLNIDPHSRTSADKLLAIAAARSARFNRLMEGVPSLLARDGSQTPGAWHDIPQEAFDRALRAPGLRTVGEVAEARLEPNGKITVIKCSGS